MIQAGQQFGRLTAMDPIPSLRGGHSRWRFRCECGRTVDARVAHVVTGATASCGGHRGTHRQCAEYQKTGTYSTWGSMRARCLDQGNRAYPKYGGRGITICVRWDSFENFLADMGERPDGMTIDRIDNNGNYEPGNCRWATHAEQQANRAVTIMTPLAAVMVRGMRSRGVSVAALSHAFGIAKSTVETICSRHKWRTAVEQIAGHE